MFPPVFVMFSKVNITNHLKIAQACGNISTVKKVVHLELNFLSHDVSDVRQRNVY